MSITKEIRDYAFIHWSSVPSVKDQLFQMCDRIDEEHQKAIRELNNLADVSVLLPVDADGVPIRVGDMVKEEKAGGGFFEPFEVVGYMRRNGVLEPMDKLRLPRDCGYLHHHHEPTVEDVLREMLKKWEDGWDGDADEEASLIAEYAAKLRLADGKKE